MIPFRRLTHSLIVVFVLTFVLILSVFTKIFFQADHHHVNIFEKYLNFTSELLLLVFSFRSSWKDSRFQWSTVRCNSNRQSSTSILCSFRSEGCGTESILFRKVVSSAASMGRERYLHGVRRYVSVRWNCPFDQTQASLHERWYQNY